MSFLNLIRYQNLIIIAAMQVFVKYGLFEALEVQLALNNFQFSLLVIATVCIAAAGNVINDIYDVEIDQVNKPSKVIVGKKISEKNSNYIFIVLNVVGVGAGFYLSNTINKPAFATLFYINLCITISLRILLERNTVNWQPLNLNASCGKYSNCWIFLIFFLRLTLMKWTCR